MYYTSTTPVPQPYYTCATPVRGRTCAQCGACVGDVVPVYEQPAQHAVTPLPYTAAAASRAGSTSAVREQPAAGKEGTSAVSRQQQGRQYINSGCISSPRKNKNPFYHNPPNHSGCPPCPLSPNARTHAHTHTHTHTYTRLPSCQHPCCPGPPSPPPRLTGPRALGIHAAQCTYEGLAVACRKDGADELVVMHELGGQYSSSAAVSHGSS